MHYMATNGGTRHFQYLTVQEQQFNLMMIVVCLTIAIPTSTVGKIAIGITILRIVGNTSRWKKWSVWAMMGLMSVVSVTDMLINLFRCGDPRAQWDYAIAATAHCVPRAKTNSFNDFANAVLIFADYFFSLLPMAIVWRLKMAPRRRIILTALLGLTIITGAAGTAKMVYAATLDIADLTWTVFSCLVWYSIETMFIIVFGSTPSLYPIWEPFFQRMIFSTLSMRTNRRRGPINSNQIKLGAQVDMK